MQHGSTTVTPSSMVCQLVPWTSYRGRPKTWHDCISAADAVPLLQSFPWLSVR